MLETLFTVMADTIAEFSLGFMAGFCFGAICVMVYWAARDAKR